MQKQINNIIKENNEQLFNILIAKYKKIIKIKSSLYTNNNSIIEDYINEAELSIYKAIDNNNKNIILNSYINKCIDNSILNYYKHINNNKNKIYNESISLSEDQLICDIRYNPEKIFEEEENYVNLKNKIISKLTWKEELVFILKEQNFTMKEISEITDSNLKTIYNTFNRVKLKISNLCQLKINT